MKGYIALFRIRFMAGLQYRAAALGGLTTQFAWGFMLLLQFSAFYRSSPASFPMSPSQIASYIWMQQAFLSLFMMWFFENDIFTSIVSGGIAYELARPMDLYNRWFCQAAASRLAKASLRCLPILAIAFCLPDPFRLSLPESAGQFALFWVSAALGLGVVVAYAMPVYITVIYTLSPLGIRLVASALADFLAGAIIPLPFFPDGLRRIAEWLPFAAMQNMPLRIYCGDLTGAEAVRGLWLQLFWLAALLLAGKLAMGRALKRIVSQGG